MQSLYTILLNILSVGCRYLCILNYKRSFPYFLSLVVLLLLVQAPLDWVLGLLMRVLVCIRVELARTVGAGVQQLACVRGHVFLQTDRPLEHLIAVLALELGRCVHVLSVLVQPLLAVEFAIADIASV